MSKPIKIDVFDLKIIERAMDRLEDDGFLNWKQSPIPAYRSHNATSPEMAEMCMFIIQGCEKWISYHRERFDEAWKDLHNLSSRDGEFVDDFLSVRALKLAQELSLRRRYSH